jgi:Protein of unknown function (DUF2585)
MPWTRRVSLRTVFCIALGLVVLQGVVLFLYGQPLICRCGYVKLWEGDVLSPGNSQHLTDWYTFSYIIHGFLFYLLLRLLFPRMSVASRFALAVGIEISWELIENTPWVIGHYREQALAQGYTGDSIINSISDTFSMMFGFLLARKLPIWSVVLLALVIELGTAYFIRDNLTLNIINLIHVFPAISTWQAGA